MVLNVTTSPANLIVSLNNVVVTPSAPEPSEKEQVVKKFLDRMPECYKGYFTVFDAPIICFIKQFLIQVIAKDKEQLNQNLESFAYAFQGFSEQTDFKKIILFVEHIYKISKDELLNTIIEIFKKLQYQDLMLPTSHYQKSVDRDSSYESMLLAFNVNVHASVCCLCPLSEEMGKSWPAMLTQLPKDALIVHVEILKFLSLENRNFVKDLIGYFSDKFNPFMRKVRQISHLQKDFDDFVGFCQNDFSGKGVCLATNNHKRIAAYRDRMKNQFHFLLDRIVICKWFTLYLRSDELKIFVSKYKQFNSFDDFSRALDREILAYKDKMEANVSLLFKLWKDPTFESIKNVWKNHHQWLDGIKKFLVYINAFLDEPLRYYPNERAVVQERFAAEDELKKQTLLESPEIQSATICAEPVSVQSIEKTTEVVMDRVRYAPLFTSLQEIKEDFMLLFSTCKQGVHQIYHTHYALSNAHDHLNDLFTLIARYMRQLGQGKMHVDQLFAHISGGVLLGNLIMEQLLQAHVYERKAPKSIEGIKENTRHSLMQLWSASTLEHDKVSGEGHQFLFDLNLIDGYVYQIAKKEDLSTVGKMVYDAYSKKVGLSSLLNQSVDFFSQLLRLSTTFLTELHTTDEMSSVVKKVRSNASLLEEGLKREHLTLKWTLDPKPVQDPLLDLHSKWERLKKEGSLSFYGKKQLNNLCDNLMRRLNVFLSYHESVGPEEISWHYASFMQLTGTILEKYFYLILDHKRVDYDKKEIDHQLDQMVLKMGLRVDQFSSEEQQFLMTNKIRRGLVRYRANYWIVKEIKYSAKTVGDHIDFVRDSQMKIRMEIFPPEAGFEEPKNKKGISLTKVKNEMMNHLKVMCNLILKVGIEGELEEINDSK